MREYFGIAASDNICNARMRGIILHIFQSCSHNCLDVYLEGIFALTDTEISIMADTCRVVLWLSTFSVNALKVGDYGNLKHFFELVQWRKLRPRSRRPKKAKRKQCKMCWKCPAKTRWSLEFWSAWSKSTRYRIATSLTPYWIWYVFHPPSLVSCIFPVLC